MSASAHKLLLYLCVWTSILQANGIQNLRYPTRLDTNWRFGKRQDLLAKSRFFMWNPALASPQMYPNLKTPLSPHNFNRYSMPPPPPMAGIHHQPNYMYNNVPTKMNYPPAAYMQPVKEIDEKRKPGNLHHITIINAIMPKPYLPTSPTLNHHHHHNHQTTSTFRNYRANNKLLYTPQYFNNNKINNNFPLQNMENLNKLTQHQQHLTLTQLQPQQPIQPMQMVYTSSPLTVKVNTPTMEYMNIVNYNTKVGGNNNDYEENEITNTVTKCGRKTKDDSNNSEQQQTIYNIPSTTTTTATSTTSSSTTSTTTTESPTTTTIRPKVKTTIKSLDNDYDFFTTEKIPIFLPTPYTPEENSFTPIASAFRDQNSLNDLDAKVQDDFKPQRYKSRFTEYEDIRPQQQRQRQSNYNNIKRQQFYTTLAPTAPSRGYDGMKLHSFFTIEDAVTRAPEMQVFNDPYQAYRHARRHHNNKQLRQNYQTTTTTTSTKEPTTTSSFPARSKFKSFFDDLDEEEYIMPENSAHYDYSLYNKPQKSSYYKANYNNENSYTQPNQILGHTYKTTIDNSYFNEDNIYMGKPKIKEHHFGLFKAITTTSTPSVTTYKPYNLRDLFLTTPQVESSFTFNPKTITFTTTTETVLGNSPGKIETVSTTFNPKTNELDPITTTSLPITTTTTRKSPRISLKTPLNLRPTNTFKYTKPRGILKSYKNLTTTTTTTTATTTLKKVSKYRRQYKGKKLKQFKHLYTTTPSTTSSSSSSTTTTEIPTTLESITKRYSFRVLPTTTTSTEQPTTRKIINSRTSTTTDSSKIIKSRQQITSSSVKSNRNKVKSTRISTTPLTTTKNPNSSTRRPSHRRGNKKANIVRNDLETKTTSTTRKSGNKRRRLSVTSTSTTIKPFLTRSTATTTSTTSTTTTTPLPPPIRKLAPTTTTSTTTTMKSIMRIANSKARTKNNNDFKSSQIRSNVINDERLSLSRMSATSTVANINIPPLPIEIYFKKSQNAKI